MHWGMSRVSLRFVDLFRRLGPVKERTDKTNPTECIFTTCAIAGSAPSTRSKTHPRRQFIRAIFVALGASIAATTFLPAKTRVREIAFHDHALRTKRTFALPEGSVELAHLERALEKHAINRVQPPTESYAVSKWEAELASHYAKNLAATQILAPDKSSVPREDQAKTLTPNANNSQTSDSRKVPDPPSLSLETTSSGNGIAQTGYNTPVTQASNFEMPAIDEREIAESAPTPYWNTDAIRTWQTYWENRRSTAVEQIEASTPSPSDRDKLISLISLENWKDVPRPTWHVLVILGIALTSFGVAQRAPIHQPSVQAPAKLPLYTKNRVEVPRTWVASHGTKSWIEQLGPQRPLLEIVRMFWVEAITTIMMIVWICG